jgi:hypothetical protein
MIAVLRSSRRPFRCVISDVVLLDHAAVADKEASVSLSTGMIRQG